MMYDDWHDGGWGPGAWIAMALMMLAFWALVVALVVYVFRSLTRTRPEAPRPLDQRDGMRILDERFARGEIDADEYTQRRDLLRSG
jgi:putative membrane protein